MVTVLLWLIEVVVAVALWVQGTRKCDKAWEKHNESAGKLQ